MKTTLCRIVLLLLPFNSFSQTNASTIPESFINIPITIDLKPIYALAEKNVSTIFSSPNYPIDWVEADCATRYKYQFRRSPLRMQMSGNRLDLGFTGFYKIIGSSRACVNGTVLSPWSPACRCGFDEGERKVNIGFSSFFTLYKNYVLQTKVVRNEPQAANKCEVCFWGQNVTASVLKGLKAELDLSKKTMEDSFGKIDLKPAVQKAWNMMGQVYPIPNVGYFSLNPKSLHMQNISGKNDLLQLNIALSASPVISISQPGAKPLSLPELTATKNPAGFNIFLEAALQYDSLSNVINGLLAGKRFDITEGLIKNHITIDEAKIAGVQNGNMLIRVAFSGSFKGTALFSGTPVYDEATRTVYIQNLDYDLQTKNLLLKSVKWLFNNKIKSEIIKHTRFSLNDYYNTAATAINSMLNKEWTKGVKGTGAVKELKLIKVEAAADHLLIRSNCSGKLSIAVTDINLNF